MSHASKITPMIAAAVMMLASCTSSRFYTPNTINLPAMSQRGEGNVNGAIFLGSSSGWEAQASYSPAPNVGLMANYFSLAYTGSLEIFAGGIPFPPPPTFSFNGRMRFGEAGAGFYRRIGKNQEFLFSLYGTAGWGHVRNRYTAPDVPLKEAEWSFWRYALQPGVQLQHNQMRFGAAFRFSYVQYTNGRIDARIPRVELDRIELLETQSPMLFWEVLWTIGYHFRLVTLSLNTTGLALGSRALNELNLASNHVSLMASLNLHELREKNATTNKKRK